MNSSNPYIYVIEDEDSLSKLICLYLEKSEMNVRAFSNAEAALDSLKNDNVPDIILLDLNLPGLSGFDFLKKLKENKDISPTVIITSARDSDEDIIKGLEYADDFITKPFSPNVLVARVKAAIRRQLSANAKAEDSIQFGEYTLLLNSCVLKKGVSKIPLSQKEYDVLEFLIKNAGTVISPEQIYQSVWKVTYGDVTAVAVYIQRLRKKIKYEDPSVEIIKTEFGKGYVFNKSLISGKFSA
ncbi:MAG: response regulator transcription factor [Treponema sp.]|nr:response regulator transcription factor [Treponema sp.]